MSFFGGARLPNSPGIVAEPRIPSRGDGVTRKKSAPSRGLALGHGSARLTA
jgi:hypothetical protein